MSSGKAMGGELSALRSLGDSKGGFGKDSRGEVTSAVDHYNSLFDEKTGSVEKRKSNYTKMVNDFYDLVTKFYEFGWGQSFHFAPRHKWETFESSIARHEMALALCLELRPGKKCLDVGSGIGGPMRTIARFSRSHVTGINNNEFQVARANELGKEAGLSHLTTSVRGDFMHMPFEDNHFDAVYQIEATCHAPDKVGIYKEIFRVLKPGGLMASYQWNTTPKYDKNNPKHKAILFGIEQGNGLPATSSQEEELDAIKAAGFEIVEARDMALDSDIPWYQPLAPSYGISGFRRSKLGRYFTSWFVWFLEMFWIAPKGTVRVHKMLSDTAECLVEGGQTGVFTPMFFTLIRKPGSA